MHLITVVLLFALALLPVPGPGANEGGAATGLPTADPSADGPFAVDVLAFPDLQDAARSRRVPVKVHLPRAPGALPVVVVSHGGGGHWDANFAQARHLATHGYAVLALEHVGSNTERMKASLRWGANLRAMSRDASEVLGRPKDVSFAIDRADEWKAHHPSLRGRLRTDRIAVLGHSFGAYTALVVGGMRPALDWLEPPVPPGHGLGPDLRDPRVRCTVALSPQGPGEPFFIEASYASLRTPLLAISGSRDEQQGTPPSNRRRAFDLWPPAEVTFVWLSGADHLAFSDATGSGRAMLPSRLRADVQPVVRAATLRFLDGCMRGDTAALAALSEAGLKPFLRGAVDAVEVRRK